MEEKRPKVGVGIFVRKEGKFLFIQRKGAHGEGTYSIPGGHLEFNETWEECATREVFEETGIKIKNVRFAGATNDVFATEGKHYVTIFMISDWVEGEPTPNDPSCPQVFWVDWNSLPSPLFLPLENFIKKGYDLFDD